MLRSKPVQGEDHTEGDPSSTSRRASKQPRPVCRLRPRSRDDVHPSLRVGELLWCRDGLTNLELVVRVVVCLLDQGFIPRIKYQRTHTPTERTFPCGPVQTMRSTPRAACLSRSPGAGRRRGGSGQEVT